MICPNCGTHNEPGYEFCMKCGTALVPLPAAPVTAPIPRPEDVITRGALRDWWHLVLGGHGRYHCYAFFLCLPSDTEAIRYLKDYGKELDMLSAKNCLVIALSKSEFKYSGFDEGTWNTAITEQISEGYSVFISQLFRIRYTEFPCIALFEDVRSPKRVVFTFKGIPATEIATQLRAIFSIIQQSISEGAKPLTRLEKHQKLLGLQRVRQTIMGKFFTFTEKTFEAAMEAWIKTVIK